MEFEPRRFQLRAIPAHALRLAGVRTAPSADPRIDVLITP
jgi:hypothetical protein